MGRIVGGRVLVPSVRSDGWFAPASTVFWDAGTITEVSDDSLLARLDERDGWEIDATGCLVLPGMVNLYDRSIETGAFAPSASGGCVSNAREPSLGGRLRNHAAELATSGITTSFLSVGQTGRPMSPTPESVRVFAAELSRGEERCIDVRLNVRRNACDTQHVRELVDLIQRRAIGMLSHVHDIFEPSTGGSTVREIGLLQARRLSNVARAARCVTASLGASSPDHLAHDLDVGIRVSILPASIELARRYEAADVRILLDTDRPQRGSSTGGALTGGLSVQEAWAAGLRPLSCSGSEHRSMLLTAFETARQVDDLAVAWAAVSRGPAVAAGLFDRGRLSPGHRADILVVEPPVDRRPPEVRAVVSAGRVVLCQAPAVGRSTRSHEQDDGLERRARPSIVGRWSPP